jgi:hypothetical protein
MSQYLADKCVVNGGHNIIALPQSAYDLTSEKMIESFLHICSRCGTPLTDIQKQAQPRAPRSKRGTKQDQPLQVEE